MLAALLLVGAPGTARAEPAGDRLDPAIFDAMAGELAKRIEGGMGVKARLLGMIGGMAADEVPSIAIRPPRPGEIPSVPDKLIERINGAMSDALARRMEGRVRIAVRGEALQRLGVEAEETYRLAMNELFKRTQPNIQLQANITPIKGGLEVQYLAFTIQSGHQMGATRPHVLPIDLKAARVQTLPAALDDLARQFAKDLPGLRGVGIKGVVADAGNGRSKFGRYVEEQFLVRLRHYVKDLESFNVSLSLSEMEKLDRDFTRVTPEKVALGEHPDAYLVAGKYWVLGDRIDLVLTLEGAKGGPSHQVSIAKAEVDVSLLSQEPDCGGATPQLTDNMGPTRLEVTTDRGKTPLYRFNDPIQLLITGGADGFLYCFALQSDRTVIRMFPNRYHGNSNVPGKRQLLIPGSSMGFKFTALPPEGKNLIKCFLTSRDVLGELPKSVAEKDFETLPVANLDALREMFNGLGKTTLSEGSVCLTTAK